MKRLFKAAKQVLLAVALTATAVVTLAGSSARAIPYNGEATQPSPVPAFNVYTGVPNIDNPDESKFFNGRLSTETNQDARDPIATACTAGTKFVLRAYVHNGASQDNNANGTGPSVAKNTKIKVALPTAQASNFAPTATISASNAASVSDNVTITCTNGKTFTLRYVTGSAQQFNSVSGVKPLQDTIVTTGAPIGTMEPNGDMWGCWDQRVWVRLEVELVEVPVEQKPATCDLIEIAKNGKTVTVKKVNYTANNATVTGISLNFGDGKAATTITAAQLPYSYTFSEEGNYTIQATLKTSLGDVTSTGCTAKVTKTPVVPPVEIPNTGAGSIVALLTGVTLASATLHNVLARRSVR